MRPNLSAAVFTPSTARRKHSTSANVERFTVHAYFHNLLRHNDLLHSGQKNVLPSLALRILLCLATFSGCVARTTPVAEKPPHELPRYAGLGDFGRKVTTTSQDAQTYFNQGLCFLYAFNHDEAIRAFQQAARLDPNLAMAQWGIALANGPHINNPVVPPERAKAAWEALTKAHE